MMQFNADDEERIQASAHLHLRGKEDLPVLEQIRSLHKRVKMKWLQFAINAAVVVLLTYMNFFSGYDFHPLFYYPLSVLFVINMGLIHFQIRQIKELSLYLSLKD